MPKSKPVLKADENKKTHATARDVARHAGVSTSTVSRVLSKQNSDLISEATRRRVIAAAEELGYTPDPIARALRGRKSNLLGLIVREIDDPFFARFTAELSRQAREMDYHIVLGYAQSDVQEALQMTSLLDTRHTDGVFILGDLKDDEVALGKMALGQTPIIALCRGRSPASLFTINSDNAEGTYELLNHLCDLGHRRIAFLDGGWLGDMRERRDAYLAYLTDRRLEQRPEWSETDANSLEGAFRAMSRLLGLAHRPTAVVAADDMMAFGAIKAITEAGLRVPQDISVVGFDDIELAAYYNPALTTVRQPIEEMARQALNLMIDLIQRPDALRSEVMIRIRPQLIIRQSSGPVARDE
jgi:DNA-binding LacI/PurR family transcriptional regulator